MLPWVVASLAAPRLPVPDVSVTPIRWSTAKQENLEKSQISPMLLIVRTLKDGFL